MGLIGYGRAFHVAWVSMFLLCVCFMNSTMDRPTSADVHVVIMKCKYDVTWNYNRLLFGVCDARGSPAFNENRFSYNSNHQICLCHEWRFHVFFCYSVRHINGIELCEAKRCAMCVWRHACHRDSNKQKQQQKNARNKKKNKREIISSKLNLQQTIHVNNTW